MRRSASRTSASASFFNSTVCCSICCAVSFAACAAAASSLSSASPKLLISLRSRCNSSSPLLQHRLPLLPTSTPPAFPDSSFLRAADLLVLVLPSSVLSPSCTRTLPFRAAAASSAPPAPSRAPHRLSPLPLPPAAISKTCRTSPVHTAPVDPGRRRRVDLVQPLNSACSSATAPPRRQTVHLHCKLRRSPPAPA